MSTSDHIGSRREWASPFHILNDATMPVADKRSLLASWASDMRGVPNYPSLRRLDDGRLVHIDEVLDALKRLDGVDGVGPSHTTPRPAGDGKVGRGHWSRLSRVWRRRADDDDDDPPPAIAAAIPRSPIPNGGLSEAALAA